jgi:hypothetical protein
MFFFEKKNQKTFAPGFRAGAISVASGNEGAGVKFFLFQKLRPSLLRE